MQPSISMRDQPKEIVTVQGVVIGSPWYWDLHWVWIASQVPENVLSRYRREPFPRFSFWFWGTGLISV